MTADTAPTCEDCGKTLDSMGVHAQTCNAPAPSPTPEYQLPCDVHLPPNTFIGKGCTLSTLMAALQVREGQSLEFPNKPTPAKLGESPTPERVDVEKLIQTHTAYKSYLEREGLTDQHKVAYELTSQTIAALRELQEARKDAQRFEWIEKNTRISSLDMGGNHRYSMTGLHRIKGPSLRDAIDEQIAQLPSA